VDRTGRPRAQSRPGQGYPQHLVNRLGTIPRGAENATAAAYRPAAADGLRNGTSNGAIAAPLLTCGGCVGVMAAEVKGDTERLEANLAAATILAQLASRGPPPNRGADTKVEAANAEPQSTVRWRGAISSALPFSVSDFVPRHPIENSSPSRNREARAQVRR
jgi:hypothetical protein